MKFLQGVSFWNKEKPFRFGIKAIQRLRFWFQNNTTSQTLKKILHSKIQKITFWIILLRENEILCKFLEKLGNKTFWNVLDFELEIIQRNNFC